MSTSSADNPSPALKSSETRNAIPWLTLLLLAAIVIAIPFYNLGEFRSLGSHEVYAAVPAREMLNSGDWIVPRFGGLPRLEKPPLAYWVVATSAKIFGGISDWSIRVPAAISAILLSLLMGFWGARWYGRMAGIAAGVVQLSAVYSVTFARKAEVDMLLCLLTTASMFLVVGQIEQIEQETRRRSFIRWTAIYALLSLAWLAKFHYGPAMVLLPTIAFLVIQRDYRKLFHLANPLGLAILCAAISVWPWLLLKSVPNAWEVWKEQTVGRAVGELGREPFWFYVPSLIWLPFPWTPFVFAAMPESWRRAWLHGPERETYFGLRLWKQGEARERFLWVWFLVVTAVISLSANKHVHYLMAALPAFSLFAGRSLARLAERLQSEGISPRSAGIFAGAYVVAGIGGMIAASVSWPHLTRTAGIIGGILTIGGCIAVALLRKGRLMPALNTALLVFLTAYIGVIGWIIPGQDHRQSTAEFAAEVRRETPSDAAVGVYRVALSSVVYYLDEPVYRVQTADVLRAQLEDRRKLLLVTFERRLPELAKLGTERIIRRLKEEGSPKTDDREPLVFLELSLPEIASAETLPR